MKLHIVCLEVIFVCFAAVTVRADSIPTDGRILVGRGSDPAPPKNCGLDFKVQLNGNHGGIKNCINNTPLDFIGLDIFGFIPITGTVTCITASENPNAAFSACSPPAGFTSFKIGKIEGSKEEVEMVLSGGVVKSGSLFFIDLDTPGCSSADSSCGWLSSLALGGNVEVEAITASPEPSSLLLLLSGTGAFCFWRRRIS